MMGTEAQWKKGRYATMTADPLLLSHRRMSGRNVFPTLTAHSSILLPTPSQRSRRAPASAGRLTCKCGRNSTDCLVCAVFAQSAPLHRRGASPPAFCTLRSFGRRRIRTSVNGPRRVPTPVGTPTGQCGRNGTGCHVCAVFAQPALSHRRGALPPAFCTLKPLGR